VIEHADELQALGPGRHFGEWYGLDIQRNYGLPMKRFALFNVARWQTRRQDVNSREALPDTELPEGNYAPACCDVVPLLQRGENIDPDQAMEALSISGSRMVPGFMKPEGIVVWHSSARQLYKMTFKEDGGKWKSAP